MYDAIIVGARCAGSPTALLLARKGSECCFWTERHFGATQCPRRRPRLKLILSRKMNLCEVPTPASVDFLFGQADRRQRGRLADVTRETRGPPRFSAITTPKVLDQVPLSSRERYPGSPTSTLAVVHPPPADCLKNHNPRRPSSQLKFGRGHITQPEHTNR